MPTPRRFGDLSSEEKAVVMALLHLRKERDADAPHAPTSQKEDRRVLDHTHRKAA